MNRSGRDARKSIRIQYNIDISLQIVSSGEYISAVCRDASAGGVGLYLKRSLRRGEKVKLWIHFPDNLGPLHRFGRVVWVRREETGFRAGVKFETPSGF